MAFSDILGIFNLVLIALSKLSFLFFCVYFGSISFKGWHGKRNLVFDVISIVVLGIICFIGGLTLQESFGLNFFLADYISAFAVSGALYLVLRLISTGFRITEKYITKTDLSSIVDDVRQLKLQVAKMSKALEEKNLMPSLLDEAGLKKAFEANLAKSGVKKFEIMKLERKGDEWKILVKTHNGDKVFTVDGYSGSVISDEDAPNFFAFIARNPLSILGFVILLGLLAVMTTRMSQNTISLMDNAFDFSFLFTPALPEGCINPSNIIEGFQSPGLSVSVNSSQVGAMMPSGFFAISGMTKGVSVNGQTYYIATAYSTPVASLSQVITPSTLNNIYQVRVCALKTDYTLCGCIGGSQADPIITVPYLVSIELIEQIMSNMLLGAVNNTVNTGIGGLLGGILGGTPK